ncbi:MAG: hypothetical protein ACOCUT_04095 [bacterium]
MKIPKLKKQMNSFLLGEDGTILKKSTITIGGLFARVTGFI